MSRTLLCFDRRLRALLVAVAVLVVAGVAVAPAAASSRASRYGTLDCNGFSTVQQTVKADGVCTDVKGILGVNNDHTWGGRFYDNGHYIGHDEPLMTFLSS